MKKLAMVALALAMYVLLYIFLFSMKAPDEVIDLMILALPFLMAYLVVAVLKGNVAPVKELESAERMEMQ